MTTRFRRGDRVADQIQRELSRLLREEIKDPRIGMVTITRVEVTDDLRTARIYFSSYGDQSARQASLAGIRKARGFIRREIGQVLGLRVVPELFFVLDQSLDHVERVSSLLKQVAELPPAQESMEPAPVEQS